MSTSPPRSRSTEAVGALQPGVYVMSAGAAGTTDDDSQERATQWFIVSDLGLTAFSGNDGIHVFVIRWRPRRAKAQVEIRLIARNNEMLATTRTDAMPAMCCSRPALTRGEGGQSPGHDRGERRARATTRFLSLKTPAFDLQRPRRLPGARCRPASMPSCTPSAASIARARPCRSRRCCATRRQAPRSACR